MAKATAKKARSKDKIDRRTGVQDAIEKGIAAIERGDRKHAHSIFQQTAELHPNISEVWVWLGGTSSDLVDAEAAFEKAYTIDPDNEQASLGLRWVRLRSKVTLADLVETSMPVPAVVERTPDLSIVEIAPPASAPAGVPVRCPNCGKTNPASEKFCLECGQDLSVVAEADMQAANEATPSKQKLAGRTMAFVVVAIIAVAIALVALGFIMLQP